MKRMVLALSLAVLAPAAPAWAAPQAPFMMAERESAVDEAIAEGKRALQAGNYEQALSSFQDAATLYPDDPEIAGLVKEAQTKACATYIKQGHDMLAQKDYEGAIGSFDSALDIDPDSAPAKKGRQLAESWPKADAYVKEAKARYAKREFDHAIAYFQKAYDLTGDPVIKGYLEKVKAQKKK